MSDENATSTTGTLIATAGAWAKALGVEQRTVTRRLVKAGYSAPNHATFTARQIFEAMTPKSADARTRLTEAQAEREEFDLQVARKTHIPRGDVTTFIRDTFAPLREFVVAMPGQLAALVNPSDPTHARRHLEAWRDEFLKHREKIPPQPIDE